MEKIYYILEKIFLTLNYSNKTLNRMYKENIIFIIFNEKQLIKCI